MPSPRTSILPLLARANAVPACRITTQGGGGFLAARMLSSTTIRANKGPVETTKETLHKADRTISDKVLKGMDKGREADKLKNQASGKTEGLKDQAQGKASELKSEAQGKTEGLAGQAQSKAGELKNQAQGKAEELSGKAKGEATSSPLL
ncbi:hypothetical protein BDW42DRAFT_187058 [Aspergillus taichungensis]|uniref:LEA domain protein n=1 Tax=Aspergillus taichungensis TaxID=482145 RepID=A0A2J5HPC0_9EURO|nr:hypothetical protein BDW42DRAFT_187058 [Aspergillus taichungensis]